MKEINPRAWIPSLNRYATGYDDLYYHRQMNGEGEWWCYPAGEDEQLDVKIELPTGLKDKNGKEIYEGDIVKDTDDKFADTGVVKWDDAHAGFLIFWSESYYKPSLINADAYVVGNIHENPELLGEEAE